MTLKQKVDAELKRLNQLAHSPNDPVVNCIVYSENGAKVTTQRVKKSACQTLTDESERGDFSPPVTTFY